MKGLTFDLEKRGPFDIDGMPVADARKAWHDYRAEHGFGDANVLTPPTGNMKLNKADVPNYGLTLRPADASGLEMCAWRTPGCTAVCVLETSFRGKEARNRDARDLRGAFLEHNPQAFVTLLGFEIRRAARTHGRIMVRLNVASDLRWEYIAPSLFDIEGALFYDYTKAPRAHRGEHPNYRLTFSVSERARSEAEAVEYLAEGGTAAVVFDIKRGGILPATWQGFEVIDGDKTDSRVFDPKGVVVGLRVKADGRNDRSGFVKEGVSS